MREQGVPCIFYPDLYGATYSDSGDDGETHDVEMPVIDCLANLIQARQRFANGPQSDIFDDPHCIAIIRHGTADAAGCVTIVSNGEGASKLVELGPDQAGTTYKDYLGYCDEQVTVD